MNKKIFILVLTSLTSQVFALRISDLFKSRDTHKSRDTQPESVAPRPVAKKTAAKLSPEAQALKEEAIKTSPILNVTDDVIGALKKVEACVRSRVDALGGRVDTETDPFQDCRAKFVKDVNAIGPEIPDPTLSIPTLTSSVLNSATNVGYLVPNTGDTGWLRKNIAAYKDVRDAKKRSISEFIDCMLGTSKHNDDDGPTACRLARKSTIADAKKLMVDLIDDQQPEKYDTIHPDVRARVSGLAEKIQENKQKRGLGDAL